MIGVRKADTSVRDKAAGAGRSRDPGIDSTIVSAAVSAAAELLVEFGYSNLSLANGAIPASTGA